MCINQFIGICICDWGLILGGVVESEGMMEWDIRYRKRLPACFVISWKGMFM